MHKGLLSFPGSSCESTKLVQNLLRKDAESHHCFLTSSELNSHLSHHLLAAYDLGAPPGLLQKIYDEAKTQRPIVLDGKEIQITEDNWTQYLGNQSAYSGFFKFFRDRVGQLGVTPTLEKYIFSSSATAVLMHVRLISGVLHPFIQLGYGLEFGNETIIAAGLAQTAVHSYIPPEPFKMPSNPTENITLFEAMRQVYDSSILDPSLPYDPNAFINARIKAAVAGDKAEEIHRICSQIKFDPERSAEECIWVTTMLLFSTGKEGRKPRLDFFLMHLVTSSLFLKPWLNALTDRNHQIQLLRLYTTTMIITMLSRGRPVMNPDLSMSYTDVPHQPRSSSPEANPWPAMIESSLHHPDSHVIKTLRTLLFAAKEYGDVPPGRVEIAKIDGSIFVRGAGVMLDTLGWVNHGQEAGDWDRSALGWDEAWQDETKAR